MFNGKAMTIRLIVGMAEKISSVCEFSQEPDSHSRNKTKVELDMSNYAIKFGVKKVTVA